MTQVGEGVAPPVDIPEEKPPKKTPIKVRCIFLFDGTMNNKTNIESRIGKNEFYEATRRKKFLFFGERVGKGAESYENGFTNIVTLDSHINEQPTSDYDLVVKIYTEGAGTMDNESDKTVGYVLGMGTAGVINKCERGIAKAVSKIIGGRVKGEEIDVNFVFVEELKIDVFGFSRGAATARYCIHKIMDDDKWKIQSLLQAQRLETHNVVICFAGLFDTVSSHGIKYSNDVRDLKLDAIQQAEKVVHLAAAEEYREKFSLTTIASAKNGEEYYLPGVHSDIGGSYLEETTEKFCLNSGWPADIEKDKANLIAEGWYTVDEIEHDIAYDEMGRPSFASITAKRAGISNAYCNIPLKIMAKHASKQNIVIKPALESEANEAIQDADMKCLSDDLKTLDANIGQFMTVNIEAYSKILCDPLLKRIRHKYMHMSSKDKIGLAPRFKIDPKKGRIRWRQTYAG